MSPRPLALATAAVAVVLASGCFRTSVQHGRELRGYDDDPFVTVEAGNVQFRMGRYYARYTVDRATHTCWLVVGGSLAPMDCCASRRVPALREVITWESDASCSRPAAPTPAVSPLRSSPAPEPSPPPDPGPPPSDEDAPF